MSRYRSNRLVVPFALLVALSAPAIAAAQGVPQPHAPVSTTMGDIAALRTAFVDAFNAKNVSAMAGMFTSDATELTGGMELVGVAAITKSMGDGSMLPHAVVASHSLKVYGTTAVDIGTWTEHPAAGGEKVSHYLVVVRHGVKGWKIQNVAIVPDAAAM